MPKIALGLGSNRGDRLGSIRRAVVLLEEYVGSVTAKSDVYETPPWGMVEQPRFLNACVTMNTELSPYDLMSEIKEIERILGRVKGEHWGPREIDVDILLYENLTVSDQFLTLPHPYMHERAFVLTPLAHIAPTWRNDTRNETVEEMLRHLDEREVREIVRIVSM